MNATVYYVVFTANEGKYQKRDYIMISNSPFVYPPKTKIQKSVISSYNMKAQIVLPFEETTKTLMNVEKWQSIV